MKIEEHLQIVEKIKKLVAFQFGDAPYGRVVDVLEDIDSIVGRGEEEVESEEKLEHEN